MLQADVHKRVAGFTLDVAVSAAPGETLVVVGESGSGKTTLMRLLAGLDRPDRGRIALGGATWFDAERRIFVAAEDRRVGYVAQHDALFPHLSVLENVAFGPRARGAAAGEARRRAAAGLERVGMAALASRRPHELSGGQQQRVALARALVLEPGLLLLDEPLSALDVRSRRTVRGELRRLLAELPCVTMFVTHSPAEALALGGRIAVITNGTVTQIGAGDELVRRPRSAYVADFMGLQLLAGTTLEHVAGGLARVRVDGAELLVSGPEDEALRAGDEAFVIVDPREVVVSGEAPAGSAVNVVSGAVEEVVPEPPLGDRVRVTIGSRPPLVAEVTTAAAARLGIVPGRVVHASFKATGARAFR